MRILVDIPQKQAGALREIATGTGKSRAEVMREAIRSYLANHQVPISAYFGLWANNPETQDVQGFLDRLRDE